MSSDPVDNILVKSEYSHFIIIGCSIAGLVWGGINAMFVSNLFATTFTLSAMLVASTSRVQRLTLLFSLLQVNKVELQADKIQVKDKETGSKGMDEAEIELFPWTKEACKSHMEIINQHVKDVSLPYSSFQLLGSLF